MSCSISGPLSDSVRKMTLGGVECQRKACIRSALTFCRSERKSVLESQDCSSIASRMPRTLVRYLPSTRSSPSLSIHLACHQSPSSGLSGRATKHDTQLQERVKGLPTDVFNHASRDQNTFNRIQTERRSYRTFAPLHPRCLATS